MTPPGKGDALDLQPAGPPWHAHGVDEVAERLDSPAQGLTSDESDRRRRTHGPNRLRPPRSRPGWMRFLAQFDNILIHVLLGAGVIALLLGKYTDAGVIAGVVVINAIIGTIQEGKAERALDAIRGMLSPQALVVRDGRQTTVPAEDLVPGDRVILTSGDRVPADLRLTRVKGLRMQEAALTGESLPVEKSSHPVPVAAPLGERQGMAYSGTLVTQGNGCGIVIATGDSTELGRIGAMLASVDTLTTPLLVQMGRLGRWLSITVLVVAAFALVFGSVVQGEPWEDMVLAAVALAVAVIPEGLPAVMTITLAIGVTRMARRNAIIRRLPAVETLGSVGVICSDKTGTLTRNELTVQAVALDDTWLAVSGVGYAPAGGFHRDGTSCDAVREPRLTEIARAGALCNDADVLHDASGAWCMTGDPTDGALVTLALKAGLDPAAERSRCPRTDTIPFESERQYMATLHHDHTGHGVIVVKGAPERVLRMCGSERTADGTRPLGPAAWHARVDAMAEQGLRVLALATRPTDPAHADLSIADIDEGLTFLGLCGLIDPPREEALAAVAVCRAAGVRIKMITGDHAVTARAIAERFSLSTGQGVLTGPELDRIDDDELVDAALRTDVFARTTPEHKLRLVKALQAAGQTVAMTGDGVNDAPALKRADIGVAMGRNGTEVAKEAAAMVLADDNFASIAHAVEEGRTVYDNLRKTILFMMPTNGAQGVVILLAVLIGHTLPITPVQILWVNMVTAVTLGLALAFERPEADVMQRPPRPRAEPILPTAFVLRMILVVALLVAAGFGFFLHHEAAGSTLAYARTMAVNALVVGEIVFLFNARIVNGPSITVAGLAGSPPVWISVGLIVALQLAFTYAAPLQSLFGTAPLDAVDWLALALSGGAIFLIVEGEKAISRRRAARRFRTASR